VLPTGTSAGALRAKLCPATLGSSGGSSGSFSCPFGRVSLRMFCLRGLPGWQARPCVLPHALSFHVHGHCSPTSVALLAVALPPLQELPEDLADLKIGPLLGQYALTSFDFMFNMVLPAGHGACDDSQHCTAALCASVQLAGCCRAGRGA